MNTETKSSIPLEPATRSNKIEKDGLTPKEGPGTASSSPVPVKRKATNLNQKNKRLRIENEESLELKITWEEAQELLRPPPKAPSIVVVDGHEFEEYEVCHSFQKIVLLGNCFLKFILVLRISISQDYICSQGLFFCLFLLVNKEE